MRDQRSSEVANGAGKVGQKRRKGIERQRGKGTNCQAQIKLQLVQIYQQTSVEGEGTMVVGVFDFKDWDEGDGFCFKMQVAGIMIITMI